MKKVKLILACFMALAAVALFADVAIVENPDGDTVTATFTMRNAAASQVVVTGTFSGWDPAGIPMKKNDAGIWEVALTFKKTEVLQYKFLADGAWMFDLKAPAKIDDGFGGFNGVVDIKKILAKSAAPAADGAAPAAKAEGPAMQDLSFGTWSIAYLDVKALTKAVADTLDANGDFVSLSSGLELDQIRLYAGSYWKVTGDILPGTNLFIEMQVLQGGFNLWQSNTMYNDVAFTTPADGLQNALETIFHPFYVFNDGGKNPLLGHFKTKLTTGYVDLFTGYNYAKGSGHSLAWTWVDNGVDAGPGFLEFVLGDKLQALGETMKLTALVGPNKRAGYGLYSWANLAMGDYAADLGFNMKSGAGTAFAFFQDYNAAVSLGGSAKFGPVEATAQALINFGSADGWKFFDQFAAKVNVVFTQPMFAVDFTYENAGKSATTIYGDTPNQGFNVIGLNPSVKLDSIGAKVGLTTETKFDSNFANIGTTDWNFYFKPAFDIDLSKFTDLKISSSTYTEVNLDLTAKGAGFKVPQTGEKVVISEMGEALKSLTLYYSFDLAYADQQDNGMYGATDGWNTVLAQAKLAKDMGATVGFTLHGLTIWNTDTTADDKFAPFGAALGWNMMLPIDKKPTLYANATYNFDPYDSNQEILDFGDNGYYRQDTQDAGYGEAHFRAGIKWSF